MIRSTKVSLKFCNATKHETLKAFIGEYRRVVEHFVNIFWSEEKISKFISSEICNQVDTWMSARALQAAAKQASGIVRGTKAKQIKRDKKLEELKRDGFHKQAAKLKAFIQKTKVSKPSINNICPQLDSRFVKIDLNSSTTFDGWVTLSSLGNKLKLQIPFNRTKHFNKLAFAGNLKPSILLGNNNIQFVFELPEAIHRTEGSVLGIDIGQNTVIACSNGHMSVQNKHGYDLNSISNILSRRKKGSKGFRKAQEHRKNYINWSINRLNLSDIREIRIEDMKHVRRGKRLSWRLGHWTYTDIFSKLESKCEELGVQVTRVSPTYTSRRCSSCGWTRRANRKSSQFNCKKCGFRMNADLNAARNIGCKTLKPIGFQQRRNHDIKAGFYWNAFEGDTIVPLVQKP